MIVCSSPGAPFSLVLEHIDKRHGPPPPDIYAWETGRRKTKRAARKGVGSTVEKQRTKEKSPHRWEPATDARREARALRRKVSKFGMMPAHICEHYSESEVAVLTVVAIEAMTEGTCAITISEIARRAGCGRTSVQNALRQAGRLGHLHVQVRKGTGLKHIPNLISITETSWRLWLARRKKASRNKTFKNMHTIDNQHIKSVYSPNRHSIKSRHGDTTHILIDTLPPEPWGGAISPHGWGHSREQRRDT